MNFKDRATLISVAIGWLITVFLVIALLGVGAMIATNQILTPEGLSGYLCYGFYKTCDTDVCISINSSFPINSDATLDPLYDWKYCTLNDTIKMRSHACIFDTSLYTLTNKALGYDVCKTNFDEGVYVFEDDFDNWQNSTSFHSNLSTYAIQSLYYVPHRILFLLTICLYP